MFPKWWNEGLGIMPKQRFTMEEMVHKRREADVLSGQGQTVALTDLRRLLTWPTVLLALSVVGIEMGYILAYRAGWKIGVTYAFASGATVALLALLGALYFGDHLDIRKCLGLVLVLLGGWLVVA